MSEAEQSRALLRRSSWLSFWTGVVMLLIKGSAWWLTRSTAILGDAAESVVHVAAVGFVVYSLRLSQKPPDEAHPYGHAKITFLSAGFEGALISVAGLFIIGKAIEQWIAGAAPQHLGAGTVLVVLALVVNGWLGWHLIRVGKRNTSLIIESNGRHVLTDAWTSIGVLAGLVLTAATGWNGFDPLCAILVSLSILWSGTRLLRRSADGLMDRADPEVQEKLVALLDATTAKHRVSWHQMRHRHLGEGNWVDFHLVFTDETTVRDAHAVASEIEREILEALGESTLVTTHLEPAHDHERIHGHAPGETPPETGQDGHLPD